MFINKNKIIMIDLNALKRFTELQQEQVKESYFNIASIAEIIGVMGMSDIVEKGDGYIRFANGIQICYFTEAITTSSKDTNFGYWEEKEIQFKEFIETPFICQLTPIDVASGMFVVNYTQISNNSVNVEVAGQSKQSVPVNAFIMGFWKEV